jgi:hypothetical protein
MGQANYTVSILNIKFNVGSLGSNLEITLNDPALNVVSRFDPTPGPKV